MGGMSRRSASGMAASPSTAIHRNGAPRARCSGITGCPTAAANWARTSTLRSPGCFCIPSPFLLVASARLLPLEQPPKLLDAESGVTYDAAHSQDVDGVVARDSNNPGPVRHDDVFALASNAEARSF